MNPQYQPGTRYQSGSGPIGQMFGVKDAYLRPARPDPGLRGGIHPVE